MAAFLLSSRVSYYGMLIMFMLLGGCLTLWLGKDLNWDLGNYHFYNPYALLHFRYDLDYWPAGLNTFYNPLMDFLIYFLINTFPPVWAGFLLGAIQGITLWLIFQIAMLVLPRHTNNSFYIAVFLALAGAFCPQFVSGIGMSLGDLTVGIFILAAIFFSLKYFIECTGQTKYLAISGFLVGFAIGLKLTSIFYGIGMCLAYLAYPPVSFPVRIKIWSLFCVTILLGMLCSSGYWMIFLWNRFHNPIYPLYNSIFHGAGFPSISWHDTRFYPHSVFKAIFYPFYFSKNGWLVDDVAFKDYRLCILYVLYLLAGIKSLWFFLKGKKGESSSRETWLLSFFLFSYILWEYLFSFLRYGVILEMLAPLMIFILVNRMLKPVSLIKLPVLTLLYAFILLSMQTGIAERGVWNDPTYFGISVPKEALTDKKAMVFLPTNDYRYPGESPLSLAYLIPYLPKHWQFVGIPFAKNHDITIASQIKAKIDSSPGPFYLLTAGHYLKKLNEGLATVGLFNTDICYEIKTADGVRRNSQIYLCKL